MASQVKVIETIHLFPKLDKLLIDLLRSMEETDWNLPTFAGNWTVKDVAVHLLDGNLRSLSMLRDGYFGVSPGEINSYQELLNYLNKLNHDWVNAMRRLSPKIIIELLEQSGNQYTEFIKSLNPEEKATFSVAWAGEMESQNWFHIAREYTEKWHHQQQIRYALQCPETLYSTEFYSPYIETSMRALPYHYRNITPKENTVVLFDVEKIGQWNLKFKDNIWQFSTKENEQATSHVRIPQKMAWKIFTKAIKPNEAEEHLEFEGDTQLGKHILGMLAVMA
ncbi:MAG TPA: maleylpyruvate isomerase N-terminal domain-containing protein [Leadbetterella sp.]|nr:maleylpyruvate isomerase N-terminal domain-containing protein [Leadbetterella sp.]